MLFRSPATMYARSAGCFRRANNTASVAAVTIAMPMAGTRASAGAALPVDALAPATQTADPIAIAIRPPARNAPVTIPPNARKPDGEYTEYPALGALEAVRRPLDPLAREA